MPRRVALVAATVALVLPAAAHAGPPDDPHGLAVGSTSFPEKPGADDLAVVITTRLLDGGEVRMQYVAVEGGSRRARTLAGKRVRLYCDEKLVLSRRWKHGKRKISEDDVDLPLGLPQRCELRRVSGRVVDEITMLPVPTT